MATGNNVVIYTVKLDTSKATVDAQGFEKAMSGMGVEVGKSTTALVNSENAIKAEIKALQKLKAEVDVNSKEYAELTQKVDGLKTSLVTAETKGLNPMINKSGLASASVVEMGRAVSDSNYGITGMANNISQLGTLMTTLIATTGGVVNGLKAMWTAMMGPIGILFAFQIIIALVERFSIESKKANKETKDLENTIGELSVQLRKTSIDLDNYIKILKRGNLSLSEQNALYDKIEKSIGKVRDENGKLVISEEEVIKAMHIKIALLKQELIIEGEKVKMFELVRKRAEIEGKEAKEFLTTMESLSAGDLTKGGATARLFLGRAEKRREEQLNVFNKQIEQGVTNIENLTRANINLSATLDDIIPEEKGRGSSKRDKELKDFEAHQLDLLTEREKWSKKEELLTAQTEESKLRIEREYAERSMGISLDEFIAKEKARLDVFLSQKGITESQRKKANEDFNKSIEDAFVEHSKTIEAIRDFYTEKANSNAKKAYKAYLEWEENEERLKQEKEDVRVNELFKEQQELNEIIKNQKKELINSLIDLANSEFDRAIDIERNKTNALNNELRARLDNENLSKEERARIQDEISANDEKLRVKQEKLEKKRFEMNKAIAISTAIVNTYLAASDVLAREKAGLVGKSVAAALIIATGLAQVAMIARQKFQTTASSSSGSGGGGASSGGGDVRNIQFNVVGRTGENQLAAAIGSKFQEPLKAYVVSKEITSQQQMDLTITKTAKVTG